MSARPLILICVVVCSIATVAHAQEAAAPPPHISFVEGVATIQHDGEVQPAAINVPVVDGDRIRTEDGRIEVMFPDGSAIEIDPRSEIEILSEWRYRVLAGTIEHRPARAADPQSPSAQNLPPGLQPYAPSLDQSGDWQYDQSYGNVWYPSVGVDWRPYYDGYWSSVGTYGWTWIGFGSWAWPTHHYGRWGFARNRWFWIPGRSFAPAWVSWAVAPGYVSWCPLGFDSRPVFGLAWSGSSGYYSRAGHDPWRAWTVIPRDHFGARGFSVRRAAIEPRHLAASSAFIVQRTAPPAAGRAFSAEARSSAPIAVPRYSPAPAAPRYAPTPSVPRYSPTPTAPRYAPTPSVPRYSTAPATPRYSQAPAAPRYSQAPAVPRYAPPTPRYPSAAATPPVTTLPHARTYNAPVPRAEPYAPRAIPRESTPYRSAPPPPTRSAPPPPRSAPAPPMHSAPPASHGAPSSHSSGGSHSGRRR
jgi:uncharacterized protein DUF6600